MEPSTKCTDRRDVTFGFGIKGSVCLIIPCLILDLVAGARAQTCQTILWEDFEEATLGGVYTAPSTNTTGIQPTFGSVLSFINDDGQIVAGLNGSSRAMQGYDEVSGQTLRLLFTPTASPTNGLLDVFFDFLLPCSYTNNGPLQMDLGTASYQNFLGVLVLASGRFETTHSTNGLYSNVYISPVLATNKQYRVHLALNLDTFKYTFNVTNLTDQALFVNTNNLDFVHSTNIAIVGFNKVDLQFGFPDFGPRPKAITFDNLMVNVATSYEGLRPKNYTGFVNVNNYGTGSGMVSNAIAATNLIYFPSGSYTINNPIVIQKDGVLFLHGADRMQTYIQPLNAGQPLFVVSKGGLISVAGLYFDGKTSGGSIITNTPCFWFTNSLPVQFEMQDCFVSESSLKIQGAGSFRVQGTYLCSRGCLDSPVVVDHPQADFLMMGGNINPSIGASQIPGKQIFHAWQKRGQMRIYSTGVQNALGTADFRIDAPSVFGAHEIANVRSEGRVDNTLPSVLLDVPSTNAMVNVMVKDCALSTANPYGAAHFVDYNAGGTLWLVGNSSQRDAGQLVAGNASNATIVALGNTMYGTNVLPVVAAAKYQSGNLYSYDLFTGLTNWPAVRFVGTDDNLTHVPPLPLCVLPAPLSRPTVTASLAGMLGARSYGAKGDGTTDDTKALQKWLDAGDVLYLPPGTYRTTALLKYSATNGTIHAVGGWIAGSGSAVTMIKRDAVNKGPVFLTQGMAYMTVQGITFQTAPYNTANTNDMIAPNVDMEFISTNGLPATQENMWYDTVFNGGKYGVGVGLTSSQQCSENMFINDQFRNARIGMGIGSYNAIANIACDSTFTNNQIAIGHGEEGQSGGTWAGYYSSIYGSGIQDFRMINSADGIWYFYGLYSNSRKYFDYGGTGASFPILFEQSSLAPSSPRNQVFNYDTGGGLIFLDSSLTNGTIAVQPAMTQDHIFNIYSTLPWPPTTNVNARAYKMQ